jgi:hypothetical protein
MSPLGCDDMWLVRPDVFEECIASIRVEGIGRPARTSSVTTQLLMMLALTRATWHHIIQDGILHVFRYVHRKKKSKAISVTGCGGL